MAKNFTEYRSGAVLLFLFEFSGELSGGESRGVGNVDAEEEQECLAVTISGSNTSHTVMKLLIAETSLHDRCAQIADDSPGGRDFCGFIFGSWSLSDEVGRDAFFGAVFSVIVVGIYGVHPDAFHYNACQLFLIFNALLKSRAFVESLEGMMLDERYAVNLDVVDLGSELDALVLLSPHYQMDIWSVDADDAVFHILFIEVVRLLTVDHTDGCDTFVLFCGQGNQRSILTAKVVPLSDEFAQQLQEPTLHPACGGFLWLALFGVCRTVS